MAKQKSTQNEVCLLRAPTNILPLNIYSHHRKLYNMCINDDPPKYDVIFNPQEDFSKDLKYNSPTCCKARRASHCLNCFPGAAVVSMGAVTASGNAAYGRKYGGAKQHVCGLPSGQRAVCETL